MKFSEVFADLNRGHKVARKAWASSQGIEYLFIKDGILSGSWDLPGRDVRKPIAVAGNDLMAEDWYVLRRTLLSFENALTLLRTGAKLAREGWVDKTGKTYIRRKAGFVDDIEIHFPAGNSKYWIPYHYELLKADWYVVN